MRTWAKVTLGILAIPVVGGVVSSVRDRPAGMPASSAAAPAITRPTTALADIDLKWEWSKVGFGSVMHANFTFENKGAVGVKDIEVTCEQKAPSGTSLGRVSKVVYEKLAPKARKRVMDFDMGFINSQAATSHCRVTNFVPLG